MRRTTDLEFFNQRTNCRIARAKSGSDGHYFQFGWPLIFTGGDDGVIHTWDAFSGRLLARQFGHTGRITRILCTPDGKGIITLSDDGAIRLWNTSEGLPFRDKKGREPSTYAFEVSPDGNTLITGAPNGQIAVWNLANGTLNGVFPALNSRLNALAVSPDNQMVMAVNWDSVPPG